jgi:hypothetical protein
MAKTTILTAILEKLSQLGLTVVEVSSDFRKTSRSISKLRVRLDSSIKLNKLKEFHSLHPDLVRVRTSDNLIIFDFQRNYRKLYVTKKSKVAYKVVVLGSSYTETIHPGHHIIVDKFTNSSIGSDFVVLSVRDTRILCQKESGRGRVSLPVKSLLNTPVRIKQNNI